VRERRYGITGAAYAALVEKQGGVCALCATRPGPNRLSVDHDHETGRIRGLLCAKCNKALGIFGDSVEGLQRVIEYLAD
jgi:hypothetical protein